ncbi:MAG: type IV pilus assembly protein PilM [Planctomycetota bacterium]|nr:type IV pilus assembly protein PilM [Planctomycetota bacterium]
MYGITRSQIQPIGLDLGHDSVKMLQLEVCDNTLKLRAAGRRMMDASSQSSPELVTRQAAQAISDLLSEENFHGHKVVVALPRQIVHIKNLRLPQMPLTELASVVQFEAKNIFAFEGEEAQVEFLPAGEVRQGSEIRQEVIVLAVRRHDVDRFVEQLHAAKVVVDSLDVEPCALYRSIERFTRRREDEQEVQIVIDIGMHRTQIAIGKGRDISFYKPIDVAGGKFNEAVSKKLGISLEEARALRRRMWAIEENTPRRDPVRQAVFDATRSIMEDLAREISLCLRYYLVTFRGQRPSRVRLVGGEAGDPQLLAILNAVLSMSVEAGRPLLSVDCSAVEDVNGAGASAEWAIAFGLGLKRTEGPFPALDGTPRANAAGSISTTEVIDLNVAMTPAKDAASRADHFAALRQASTHEHAGNAHTTPETIHA